MNLFVAINSIPDAQKGKKGIRLSFGLNSIAEICQKMTIFEVSWGALPNRRNGFNRGCVHKSAFADTRCLCRPISGKWLAEGVAKPPIPNPPPPGLQTKGPVPPKVSVFSF
jgi:hypothetical protein